MCLLSVAICTRNREKDLSNTLASLKESLYSIIKSGIVQEVRKNVELLIIDDGDLQKEWIEKNITPLQDLINVRYIKKKQKGLYQSRIKAVNNARGEYILFLDDDVIVENNFFVNIFNLLSIHPDAVGIGGIDILLEKPGILKRIFDRFFFLDSGDPGKLSISTHTSSVWRRKSINKSIDTDYLTGFCMLFKRSTLLDLPENTPFSSYSLGEDIFLSLHALKTGKLFISPLLRVKHMRTPVSRDSIIQTSSTMITNHYYLLNMYMKLYTSKSNKIIKLIAFWHSNVGLLIHALIKDIVNKRLKLEMFRGRLRGILNIIKQGK